MGKQAIIIGAGPAGLTAAYELLKRTDIKPIILEKSGDIGGISKTIKYKGNRMDIGGHRFFSKSDRVMNWWLNIMPLEKTSEENVTINYQNKARTINSSASQAAGDPTNPGLVMLLRKRLSRIYFLRKFFNYPIQLSIDTLRKLGLLRTIRILLSYLFAQLVPRKPEKSLEDFLINRFGRELYLLFFKDYTEKVWGVPCNEISAEWGAQRIKGVSISKAIQHAAQMMMKKKKKASGDISQKDTETSLIEQFLYPALGPGQLWEEVARQIEVLGGTILMHQNVKSIELEGDSVKNIVAVSSLTGEATTLEGDYFFSTMPVQELIAGMQGSVPTDVKEIAAGLQYRDFITVGVLLEKLSTADNQPLDLQDTWIYIQERDVKVGRLQLFNNWSPYMVNKPGTVWIGMEYFCNEGDDFWRLTDEEIKRTAVAELEKMGLAQVQHVLDSTVHRVEKTYPAYFGTYNQFDKIRAFTDRFANLFLVGRNGMHKYNNADHSMLTAMVSVDNIAAGITSKENIWAINTEQEYHEEKNNIAEENSTDLRNKKSDLSPIAAFQPNESFKEFMFKNRQNRQLLLWSAILVFIQLAIFKYLYPFPSFINDDSYNYLDSAAHNFSINIYPTGYSMFLRLFSVFSKSDILLISFQFLFLQASILSLLFTIFYWYKPAKITRIILLAFLIINPVFLYLANYVSSDAYFTSLSLTWFTLLLWIIHSPNIKLIVLHGLVLYIAYTVRYNALYYPLIAAFAFFYNRKKLLLKYIGLALAILFIGAYTLNKGYHYKRLTGRFQLTPFSGWQLANNAMFTYRYVDSADRKPVPSNLKALDNKIWNFFDMRRDPKKFPMEAIKANTFYMWTDGTPLRDYMNEQFQNDSTASSFRRWSSMGPLYNEYGAFIIKKYPLHFLKYFIWPNTLKYYAPSTEFLGQYNMGTNNIKETAQDWFGFKTDKVYNRVGTFDVRMLDYWPIAVGIIHILFLIGLVSYWLLNGPSNNANLRKVLVFVTAFWIINFGFSVFAASISLRMQLFQIIITVSFSLLFLEFIVKAANQPTSIKQLESYPSLQG